METKHRSRYSELNKTITIIPMSHRRRCHHYNKGNSCNYVCISFVPFSSFALLLKYIDVDKYYLQKWPLPTQKLSRAHTHTHTPLPGGERCDTVNVAGCSTRTSVVAVAARGRWCSRCAVWSDRRSECLGCAGQSG